MKRTISRILLVCATAMIVLLGGCARNQGPASQKGGPGATPAAGSVTMRQEKLKIDDMQVEAIRASNGSVVQVRHEEGQAFTAKSAGDLNLAGEPSARQLADAYVRVAAQTFSLSNDWTKDLTPAPQAMFRAEEPTTVHFSKEKKLGDATVVSYAQWDKGLPVWQSGLAVTVLDKPVRVVSATNSVHANVDARAPGPDARFPVETGRNAAAVANALGLREQLAPAVKLNGAAPWIYQYDPNTRIDPESNQRGQGLQGGPPTLPLPAVPAEIKPGDHRVVTEVLFTLPVEGEGDVNWRAFVDAQTGSVLYLRAFVAHFADGMVFRTDPITATGDVTKTPSAPVGTLDALRTTVGLVGLDPPVPPQNLTGSYVKLVDRESPTDAPPTENAPFHFNYSANTGGFAAVNAYYHCDGLFRLLEHMGITVSGGSGYFDETTFPVQVDHRGYNNALNARAPGNTTGTGSDGFFFGVAASGTGVPIAADWRVVLHEFGHALLWDSVHSPNFGFAHSAGDSLGAILNDPESKAPDRGVTFPWVNIGRRHDRAVAAGWGWGGANDVGNYSSEQILSTTTFRLYRAIGGDSMNVGVKQLGSWYAATLIVRGIGLLATDPVTPSPTPDIFETAMMNADKGTALIEGYPGGAVHKVIRWAFEKQGLHRAPTAPSTSEGAPPPVDVYIDDGRNGEYLPYLENFWETTDIWNRNAPDGGTTHETPILSVENYLYVRIKNRGTQTASGISVRTYHNRPAAGLSWPGDWQPMTTAVLPGSGDPPISLTSGGTTVVGPFKWTPQIEGHECLLASVSATDDLSNIDPASVLPVNTGPTPHWRLVPFDNNIAQRNVAPVPGGGGGGGLSKALDGRKFMFRNPYPRPVKARIGVILPKVLADRGWKIAPRGIDANGFTLDPNGRREITLAVERGKEFSSQELARSMNDAAIRVIAFADDMPIGGMTYWMDPKMTEPPDEHRKR